MLVFLALGNAKVLSFALGDTKVPNTNDFASQWNIGFKVRDIVSFVFVRDIVIFAVKMSILSPETE